MPCFSRCSYMWLKSKKEVFIVYSYSWGDTLVCLELICNANWQAWLALIAVEILSSCQWTRLAFQVYLHGHLEDILNWHMYTIRDLSGSLISLIWTWVYLECLDIFGSLDRVYLISILPYKYKSEGIGARVWCIFTATKHKLSTSTLTPKEIIKLYNLKLQASRRVSPDILFTTSSWTFAWLW